VRPKEKWGQTAALDPWVDWTGQIESDSREIWGQSHQPKRRKLLIRDTQQNPQEIVLKTPPRKSQQRAPKNTTNKDGKSTTQPWGTTTNNLYIPWRFVQGLSCHPYIHPSLNISHEALKLVLGKTRGKWERKWKNKWARVPRVGCHPSPQEYIWRHPKDYTTLT
jgi:hypothetical protein